MPGVGKQGDRVGQQAVKGLDRDEADVERDPDQEGAAVIGRRMLMSVAMIVRMAGAVGDRGGQDQLLARASRMASLSTS